MSVFAVQTLQFADGTSVNVKDFVMQRGIIATGTAGDDVLRAEDLSWFGSLEGTTRTPIPDRLEGGQGNDTLIGGGGGDIYVFNRGDGADVIVDSAYGMTYDSQWYSWLPNGANTLEFGAGIAAGDVTVKTQTVNGIARIIFDLGNGDSVDIGSATDFAVQAIRFADGATYTPEALMAQRPVVVSGTDGADYLVGTSYTDDMRGQPEGRQASNDILWKITA